MRFAFEVRAWCASEACARCVRCVCVGLLLVCSCGVVGVRLRYAVGVRVV